MEKPVAPCKGCDRRTAECHATCSGYAEFIEKQSNYKRKINSEKAKDFHERGKWNNNRKNNWAKAKGLKK